MAQGIRVDCQSGEVSSVDVSVAASIPSQVTMRQARLALRSAGLLANVETALAAMASPAKEIAKIEWEYASGVRRDSPLIGQLAVALGLTSAQVDALFVSAVAL